MSRTQTHIAAADGLHHRYASSVVVINLVVHAAPVVMRPTWMGPGSEATVHTSASRAGRALEGRLRHLLHRGVAPSTSSATNRAGIRKYYAFCQKFNLTTLPRNQALHQPFYRVSQSNAEWGRFVYGRGKFIKVGMLTPLDFVPRGVGYGSEGRRGR